MSRAKIIVFTSIIFLISIIFAFIISEAAIRIIRPDIKDIVESKYERHRFRIYANPKLTFMGHNHPDTGIRHTNVFNSIGTHQHREFTLDKPSDTFRIGFFGDSYTENRRIPIEYSFTEPLDYLLNRSGRKYEIINFGTDGYGTDQVYLQYMDEGVSLDLDTVVYVYCWNDLMDIMADELIDVDDKGKLRYLPMKEPTFFINIARRFHLTYFLIESFSTLNIHLKHYLRDEYDLEKIKFAAENEKKNRKNYKNTITLLTEDIDDPDIIKALNIFSAIISNIKKETSARGQDFYAVLLPITEKMPVKREHNLVIKKLLETNGVDVLDLDIYFDKEAPPKTKYFFKNDNHWNEEGNKITTVYLFKFLAEKLGLDYGDDNFIKEGLSEYYSSFAPSSVSSSWLRESKITEAEQKAIKDKYRALDKIIDFQKK